MSKDIITEHIISTENTNGGKKQKTNNSEKKQRTEKENTLRKYIILISVIFAIVLVLFSKLIIQYLSVRKAKEEAMENLARLENKVTELENTLERVNSLEYIENQARTLLKMVYPKEVLYIIEDEK